MWWESTSTHVLCGIGTLELKEQQFLRPWSSSNHKETMEFEEYSFLSLLYLECF